MNEPQSTGLGVVIKDVRSALSEALIVLAEFANAWPQDSLPAHPLCMRLASVINGGRAALAQSLVWRDVDYSTPTQTPILVKFNRPGVVREVPIVALVRIETDRWVGGRAIRKWYAFGASFDRIDTPAQWRPLYDNDGSDEVAALREALVQADLTIRALPGTDQSHVEFIRKALEKGDR